MATINSIVSMGYTGSNTSTKNDISDLRKKINDLNSDTSLTADEKKAKQKEYKEQMESLTEQLSAEQESQLATIQNNAATFFNNPNTDLNQTGYDFFFGANASMASLKAVNSARVSIENRARTLLSEIKMDEMRGINTASKKETLSNLTENLSIMDSTLSGNVDKAVNSTSSSGSTGTQKPIIDQINDQLKSIQETESKKVKEEYGTKEDGETEEA